jgi:glycosyltransferase involved in cell wall biosynthesis
MDTTRAPRENRSTRPLRIFHLIKSLGRGGAEMLLVEGIGAVDSPRVTFGVGYFLPWKDTLVAPLRARGAEVICFDVHREAALLLRVPAVARFIRRWHADVLHCHLPLAGVVGRLAGRLAHVPVVYTEHNVMERYHPWTRRLNLATWRLQDHAVAVSGEVADSIRRHAPASVPVTTIRNGVPVASFAPEPAAKARIRASVGIPEDAPVVGTVAVFRTQKRLDLWLDTAARVAGTMPAARFLLVGDGPLRVALEAKAVSLGLGDAVHFVGLQTDVRAYLAAMDVYLLSSDFEGLPLGLLEAMAAERPAVATMVGGIPEVVVDGETGSLVRPRDVEGLAAATTAMLADGERRRRMGRAARARAEQRYSIGEMNAELERLWSAVRCKAS